MLKLVKDYKEIVGIKLLNKSFSLNKKIDISSLINNTGQNLIPILSYLYELILVIILNVGTLMALLGFNVIWALGFLII